MKIDFPDHKPGPWERTPMWMLWRSGARRKNWRWIVDHCGCQCVSYWEYQA